MRRFQEFNHGRRRGSNLDDVLEAMGVGGRTGTIHDAIEDAKLALHLAGLFYMMDNRIKIPNGKPVPPSRREKFGEGSRSRREQGEPKSNALIIGAVIVVFLLAWWLL